jgi:hypothetical protein
MRNNREKSKNKNTNLSNLTVVSCGIFFNSLNFLCCYSGIVIISFLFATGAPQNPFLGAMRGVQACFLSFRGIEAAFTPGGNE